MVGVRPKQFARMGEFYLEEAVLDVLLEAEHEGDCLGPAEISRRAGIYREGRVGMKNANDWLVHAILSKLFGQGRVERCTQHGKNAGGWKLTTAEFERRRDDVG